MELDPLGGNPALEAENAQLGVGAEIVREAREEHRQKLLPARAPGLREGLLERVLIDTEIALREIERGLPDALRELCAAIGILDVLVAELPASGAERAIEEEHCLDARRVDRLARLPEHVERAEPELLA